MSSRGIPSLNALRAFEVAARRGSFVEAAEELFVTPAAISHQIKGLEEYLDVILFERNGRNVQLTEAGKRMLPELQRGFTLIENAIAKLDEETHLLTVSANPAFSAKWLLPRIHLFNQKHPEIDVRLDASNTLSTFQKDGVDLAIRFGSGDYPGMVTMALSSPQQEEIFPVCSPRLLRDDHPLQEPADLRFYTLLHDETNSSPTLVPDWQHWLTNAGVTQVDASRGMRFSNSIMAIEAAINGQGVALSCGFTVSDDLAAGRLIRPFVIPCQLSAKYHIVFPEHKRTAKVEKFCAWLLEMTGK